MNKIIKAGISKKQLMAALLAVVAVGSNAYAQDVAELVTAFTGIGVIAVTIWASIGSFNLVKLIAAKTAALFGGKR